jgi:hypothetical protein
MNAPLAIMSTLDKVKDALYVWAESMRRDDHDLGFNGKSSVFSSGGLKMWDELENSADSITASAVEAIMEGMPTNQTCAVHHFHLAAVYKPRRTRIEDDYADALVSLEIGLRRRSLL